MKKNIIIAVNIILMLAYFSPACYLYLSMHYVKSKFKKLNLKYKSLGRFEGEEMSLEVNGLPVVLKSASDDKEDRHFDVYVNSEKLTEHGLRESISIVRTPPPSIDLIDIDGDGLDELYFYSHTNDPQLLDFYKEGDELKYRLTDTDQNSFIGKHFYRYRSDYGGEGLVIGVSLMGAFVTLALHLVILLIAFLVWKFFFS